MGYPITAFKRIFDEDIEWKLKNKCVYALQSRNLPKFQLPAIFYEGQLEKDFVTNARSLCQGNPGKYSL